MGTEHEHDDKGLDDKPEDRQEGMEIPLTG